MSGRPSYIVHDGKPDWPVWNATFLDETGATAYHCAYRRHVCSKRYPKVCEYPYDLNPPFKNETMERCPRPCPICANFIRQHNRYPKIPGTDLSLTDRHFQQLAWHDGQACDNCNAADEAQKERRRQLQHRSLQRSKRKNPNALDEDELREHMQKRQQGGGSQSANQYEGQGQINYLPTEKKKSSMFSRFGTKQKEPKPSSHSSPKPTTNSSNMALRPRQTSQPKSVPKHPFFARAQPPKSSRSPPQATRKAPSSKPTARAGQNPKKNQSLQGAKQTEVPRPKWFKSTPGQKSISLPILAKKNVSQP